MKFLVTGANGLVGKSLCTKLSSMTCALRAAVRFPYAGMAAFEQVLVGPINANTDWSDALKQVDVVVHLAARVHVMRDTELDPLAAFRAVNVAATLTLARQAAAAGIKRLVYLSSIGVNGMKTEPGILFSETDKSNPHNTYALSKWEAEQGLLRIREETGLDVVIIRSPLVYGYDAPGNFGALLRAILRGWPLPLGAVHNQRSLVALDNLVDFIVTCSSHPQAANQTFLVSDGHDLSTTELVRGMAHVAGVPVRLLPVPVWALQAGASLLGKGDAVQRLCGNLQVDISKARRLLGWVPPITVDEGLRRVVANRDQT